MRQVCRGRIVWAVLGLLLLSMTIFLWFLDSRGGFGPPPQKDMISLGKDQEYAYNMVQALAQASLSDMPWQGGGMMRHCLGPHDQIRGYKTRERLSLRSENVGQALDDSRAIENARSWFLGQGFDIVEDVHFDNGMYRISAVKEDVAVGIGISITAHPGVVGITGTTRCRS